MSARRLVHTRSIRADVFARDDGLWDIEAELVDTKARDFKLATGLREAGDPMHRMRLTVTIDTRFNVVDAQAHSLANPYFASCSAIEPAYAQLIGLNLMNNFRRDVRARLGGTAGCTHMTELTNVIPTAAVQAFAGEVVRTRDGASEDEAQATMPWQLDRCHALRLDGPAVAEFYPRWARPGQDESKVGGSNGGDRDEARTSDDRTEDVRTTADENL